MKRHGIGTLAGVALLLCGVAGGARAQGIAITPQIGAYTNASSFDELRSSADQIRVQRQAQLGLGVALELGHLRGSLSYVSGATLDDKGPEGLDNVGDGKLLAAAVDYVLRPLPRIVTVQPYLLGGVGYKRADYSFNDDRFRIFDRTDSDLALHAGLGVDVMFGPIGVQAEVTDYISKGSNGASAQHDAFGTLGLRLHL